MTGKRAVGGRREGGREKATAHMKCTCSWQPCYGMANMSLTEAREVLLDGEKIMSKIPGIVEARQHRKMSRRCRHP